MDWLDKAAENFVKTKEVQDKQKQMSAIIKESYPRKVSELWASFKEMHETIGSKFGSSTNFFSNPNQMQSVIGGVVIKGIAQQANKVGGYYGLVKINIEYTNSANTRNVHFDELLLGEVNGEPTWVYRDVVNDRMSDVVFDKADLEKVFKNALSIYLK